MNSVVSQNKAHYSFSWDKIGNIKEGRGDLGEEVPVLVYRLMQYSMLDVLGKALGPEAANKYFRDAGYLAGMELARNALDLTLDFDAFSEDLKKALKDLKIGILNLEKFNRKNGDVIVTVGQDLDCSGFPVSNDIVCHYDEGFIAGIFEAYTGQKYDFYEVDCWSKGDRVCRFNGVVVKS